MCTVSSNTCCGVDMCFPVVSQQNYKLINVTINKMSVNDIWWEKWWWWGCRAIANKFQTKSVFGGIYPPPWIYGSGSAAPMKMLSCFPGDLFRRNTSNILRLTFEVMVKHCQRFQEYWALALRMRLAQKYAGRSSLKVCVGVWTNQSSKVTHSCCQKFNNVFTMSYIHVTMYMQCNNVFTSSYIYVTMYIQCNVLYTHNDVHTIQ